MIIDWNRRNRFSRFKSNISIAQRKQKIPNVLRLSFLDYSLCEPIKYGISEFVILLTEEHIPTPWNAGALIQHTESLFFGKGGSNA